MFNAAIARVQDDIIRTAQMHYGPKRRKALLPESNLDVLFTNMYHYFFERGFVVIVAKHVTNLMYVWLLLPRDARDHVAMIPFHAVVRRFSLVPVQNAGIHDPVFDVSHRVRSVV